MVKFSNIVVGVAFISTLTLIFLHIHLNPLPSSISFRDIHGSKELFDIIHIQNETIAKLLHTIDKGETPIVKSLMKSIADKEMEISKLLQKIEAQQQFQEKQLKLLQQKQLTKPQHVTPPIKVDTIESQYPLVPKPHEMQHECEKRYGLELIDLWRKSEQVWCQSDSKVELPSTIKCYPYTQEHKRRDGRGADMFCVATNIFIDFSKVSGTHVLHGKPPHGDMYLNFQDGSIYSSCTKTDHFQPQLFMSHHSRQMRSFVSNRGEGSDGSYAIEEKATYLLARDEDCENAFHSTADFMNMFFVLSILKLSTENLQVMLFDKHSDGPYFDLIQTAFSRHPVIRHGHYNRKTILFRQLIFHLESPAGLIFPKVANPDPMRCHSTGLFQSYRKFVLNAFNLWNVPPPPIPSVLLSLRHRTQQKNVGRVLGNEEEVIQLLKSGNMMKVRVLDTAILSYAEQIKAFRESNVIVGVHGAGLMFIMFAADEAVLVEIHPSYRQDRHFRHAARLSGKIYLPLRASQRETCVGSSDTVIAPIDELRRTMDGAIRLARSFDDGLSECGLVCPASVLAIDGRLDPFYHTVGMQKGQSLNLHFPC